MTHFLTHTALLALLTAAIAAPAQAQYTTINKSTAGVVADDDSGDEQASGDGRFVVFASKASNLVAAGDTNGYYDVYLRDTLLGTTERISMGVGGVEPDGDSRWPVVSDDGRFVAFGSTATNLVSGDTNGDSDAFLYDRTLGTMTRCSISYLGIEADGPSAHRDHSIDVSDDGRYVVFESISGNLVSELTSNASVNVFIRDVTAGTTTLISVAVGGWQSDGGKRPSIDADGNRVAFVSGSHLIHPSDSDGNDDVFVWHRETRGIELVSATAAGTSGSSPGNSTNPRITPDSRYVVFESTCTDLDPADTTIYRDIYVRDRTAGTTEVVSYHSDGGIGPYTECSMPDISADGRYVVFETNDEMTNVVHNTSSFAFVYLRDRTAGTTEFISTPRWWFAGSVVGGAGAHVADDGSKVIFRDDATFQETPTSGGTFNHPIVERARDGETNLMSMTMYDRVSAGSTFTVTAYDGPASAPYWVLRSSSASGITYDGHDFDLGGAISVLGTGTTDADGMVSWTSPAIPGSASGRTIYVEVAARSAGTWRDSNYAQLEIL